MTDQQRLAWMLEALGQALDSNKLAQLIWFRDELLRWNRRVNLTAITDPAEALEKHLVDSLTVLPFMEQGKTLLDIGSGGGFPSIPLKIARPDWVVWSVDSNTKKIVFQNHVVRSLGLEGFSAIHSRAEKLSEHPSLPVFDLVTSRAFAPLASTLELAGPLLDANGMVVVMKGPEGEKELAEFTSEKISRHWACREVRRLQLPHSKAERMLLIFVRRPS
jgi:16S rRNA (guanine527-N7)-methyltransferase